MRGIILDSHTVCTYNVCMIEFEWDKEKARKNLRKHQLSFTEAKSVFYDVNAIQFFDNYHSLTED